MSDNGRNGQPPASGSSGHHGRVDSPTDSDDNETAALLSGGGAVGGAAAVNNPPVAVRPNPAEDEIINEGVVEHDPALFTDVHPR